MRTKETEPIGSVSFFVKDCIWGAICHLFKQKLYFYLKKQEKMQVFSVKNALLYIQSGKTVVYCVVD